MKRRSFLQLGLVALSVPAYAQKKRWAMVIDERKCAARPDCNACATACHHAHNVPAMADKRHEVKWIWKERFENVFPDRVNAWTPAAARRRRSARRRRCISRRRRACAPGSRSAR